MAFVKKGKHVVLVQLIVVYVRHQYVVMAFVKKANLIWLVQTIVLMNCLVVKDLMMKVISFFKNFKNFLGYNNNIIKAVNRVVNLALTMD